MKATYFKYLLFLIVSLFHTNSPIYGQDPVFSQFYTASMFLNPALAAEEQSLNVNFNNRTYTNTEISSYSMNQITCIIPFDLKGILYSQRSKVNHKSGAGLSIYREATGTTAQLNSLGILASVAHSVQIAKEHYLSLGIQGGYIYKYHNDEFNWGSQYDPDLGYDPNNPASVDDILKMSSDFPLFNAGIMWFYKNSELKEYIRKFNVDVFTGISAYNINTPNQSFFENKTTSVPMTLKVHGGISYKPTSTVSIVPNYIWVNQNENNQINFGSYVSVTTQKFVQTEQNIKGLMGVWYRVGDSFIFSFGAVIKTITFGVSYDFNTSNFKYNDTGKGTIEFSIKYSATPTKRAPMRGLYSEFL